MRSAAHTEHRAVQSHCHGWHSAPPSGQPNRLAFGATFTASRAVLSASAIGLGIGTVFGWGNLETIALAVGLAFVFGYALTMVPMFRAGMAWWGTFHMRTPAMRTFWPGQAAFRSESPATGALLALAPLAPGALAAAVLNSFDWCYGEVRITLAVCLICGVASGTLLLCWSFDSASMRRSVAYAVAAGLGAAMPLLQFG